MNSNEIRNIFLEYFQSKGHKLIESSSLIPDKNDQSLLFTNAGMNQFKDLFLGSITAKYKKAVTAQRCVRAGGKHNDLENVGNTARHHTFFEMLGNFSFGDYFKKEAISYSWDFLTNILKIPQSKLWVTVHHLDTESKQIWLDVIKVNNNRISYLGNEDNYWSMGDTGPCGPCTEIFYDHGELIDGDPPGGKNADGDRYVEIWNMVFMEFNKHLDGKINRLPKPCVDTGMGLERISAVMQGCNNNYDTDLFTPIIAKLEKILKKPQTNEELVSIRIIADHIRSCAYLIADGIQPSNTSRGYVLRRIIRRAARHGYKLGKDEPFLCDLLPQLITAMGSAGLYLKDKVNHISKVLKQEEQTFLKTLGRGIKILSESIAKTKSHGALPGELVFKLYDTYGFPIDLTKDIAKEHGLSIDEKGYEKLMDAQKTRARATATFKNNYLDDLETHPPTEFLGYNAKDSQSQILGLWVEGKRVESLKQGEMGQIVLNKTPFYAEAGGQVGDTGLITTPTGVRFIVKDTIKIAKFYVHLGIVEKGVLTTAINVNAVIDNSRRQNIQRNHSATHLLHMALEKVLGPHAEQRGSLVTDNKLRFDFAHPQALSESEKYEVENIVNKEIMQNSSVITEVLTLEQAKKLGAKSLFGEKYDEQVRVLTMGNPLQPSIELCGGTHVERTGDIGQFRIVSESSIALGVRRIEAVTGFYAQTYYEDISRQLNSIGTLLKVAPEKAFTAVKKVCSDKTAFEQQLKKAIKNTLQLKVKDLVKNATFIDSLKCERVGILIKHLKSFDEYSFKDIANELIQLKESYVCVFTTKGKVATEILFAAVVTKRLEKQLSAKKLIAMLCEYFNGRGGGRNDFAQGVGKNTVKLETISDGLFQEIKEILDIAE